MDDEEIIQKYGFGVDADRDRKAVEAISGGRQVIVKYKKGGRIKERIAPMIVRWMKT